MSGQNHSTQDSSRILRSHDRIEGGWKKESAFEDDKETKMEKSLEQVKSNNACQIIIMLQLYVSGTKNLKVNSQ